MADEISASISQAGAPSFYEVRADTGMSASNYDRRPDDDDLYYSGDEEIHSTVGVDQTHSDDPVNRNGESHNDVRASDEGVQEIWIRRAKGRVSSTTTKFVRSCILRGNTANSRATVSFLSVKSKSVVPRKFDYMKLPDLTQFSKKDQNIRKDPSRFDFTPAELIKENNNDELRTNTGESSTKSQEIVKVPFSRSNSTAELRQIDMDQSASHISSQAATAPVDQSGRSTHGTIDQSEAAWAQPDYYKSSNDPWFDITAISETEDTSTTENSSAVSSTSNSIDFLESCARPCSSSLLKRTKSNLAWLVRSNHHRILKRRIRPLRPLIYRLLLAIYVVIGLCSEPIFAYIWSAIMGSSGTALLRLLQALRLGLVLSNEDVEPDSDD